MKKWIFLLLMSALLTGCEEAGETKAGETETVLSLGESKLVLEGEELRLQKEARQDGIDTLYEDTRYELRAGNGKMTILVRKLSNGDRFVMMRVNGEAAVDVSVPMTADDYYLVDWTKDVPERQHDSVTGIDSTGPPLGLFRFTNEHSFHREVVMSRLFQSRTLRELYGGGRESIVRELIQESDNVSHTKNGLTFTMASENGEIAEQWFLLAEAPLFSQTDHLNSWIAFQKENYKEVNNWFTIDGPMKKLPWSIEPFTKNGYGRSPGMMMEKAAVDHYFKLKDRYFYNLAVQSAANLWAYRDARDDAVWKTEFTSTWLKSKYDITAPYVDTRHNELIALNLHRLGKALNVPELEAALTDYSDYLLNLISIDNVVPAAEGYYPADYYSPQQGRQFIHASLNHALGEANMFIEAYIATGEKKYLFAARDIRKAIESTGEKWIRPNGDLWYQINMDGSFDGNDYERLTLQDLREHEKKWAKVGGNSSKIVQKLIESKEQYLNSD